jgi:ankyrin repeat protein
LIYAKNYRGRTPLHIACYENSFDSIQLLIKQYEYPYNILDNEGNSIVHAACASLYTTKETVSYIIEHCTVPLSKRNTIGMTPFHLVCSQFDALLRINETKRLQSDSKTRIEILSYLLQLDRTQLNMKTNDGKTPLHLACGVSNIDVIKFLLDLPDCSPNTRGLF